ncbi:hypothetical protein GCM10007874_15200 [Labrys miyagiensis]|uniref:Uncharacterized protein n=1 Tax=Labrys miyagiensis TaxID=346912 RepID=A0ABQ6CFQ7_9HYPH|nr:hypothetical protein GCM10007874_15200 [Labrys miyagiensis]
MLVAGAGADAAAQAAARLAGVDKVLVADASYEHRLAEPTAGRCQTNSRLSPPGARRPI